LDGCGDVKEGTCLLTHWLSSQEDPWHAIDVVYGWYEGMEGMVGTELSASNAACAGSACGRWSEAVNRSVASDHQGLSELVAQSCVSIYYNLWNIRKATGYYFSDCFSDHGILKKAK
jgi:hypothetical protein